MEPIGSKRALAARAKRMASRMDPHADAAVLIRQLADALYSMESAKDQMEIAWRQAASLRAEKSESALAEMKAMSHSDLEIASLRIDLAEAHRLLRQVEWVSRGNTVPTCPWCKGVQPNHQSGCLKQRALLAAPAEMSGTPEGE